MKSNWKYLVVAVVIAGALFWWNASDVIVEPEALVEVTVPTLTNEQQAGEGLFNKNCSSCHGINAAGVNGLAPPLVHIIYEPGHHGDQSFLLAAKKGVRGHHWPFGNMPPVEGISDGEVTQIIEYVRVLQRANGIN